MRIIADFHFHSRFSRACSKDLTIPNLARMAEFKGVHVLGTGDSTHPQWFSEIKKYLTSAEEGLYKIDGKSKVRFVLTSEISSIYKQGVKTRRVHTVFVFPSIEVAEKFNQKLIKRGANLSSDGRPIVGISAEELALIALEIDPKTMVIPAHIWTPWFAMFGSMSGFDSVEECFGKAAANIFAVEMGMSSDAAMNWRVSNLDRMALIASSDAHSLHRIAREGNAFEIDKLSNLSYNWITRVLKEKDPKTFLYAIKYYPEEGRYHLDGHDKCNFSCKPEKTKKLKGICPVCGRPLTIGVLNRVDQLADRPVGFMPKNAIPTKHLVPLEETIADAFGMGVSSKKVQAEYNQLVTKAGGEYQAMLDLGYNELEKMTLPIVVEAIRRNREEKLHIEPGFDGRYGKIEIFTRKEREEWAAKSNRQKALF